jgi:hypothetical protein
LTERPATTTTTTTATTATAATTTTTTTTQAHIKFSNNSVKHKIF